MLQNSRIAFPMKQISLALNDVSSSVPRRKHEYFISMVVFYANAADLFSGLGPCTQWLCGAGQRKRLSSTSVTISLLKGF